MARNDDGPCYDGAVIDLIDNRTYARSCIFHLPIYICASCSNVLLALRLSEVSNEPLDLFISLNTHGIPFRKVVGFETLSVERD